MRQVPVADFERDWRNVYDSVFNGALVPDRPFRNEAWETFLFPYALNMEEDIFASIGAAARQQGDDECFIWNAEVLVPEPGAIIPWRHDSLDQARCTVLGHFETHLFGRSRSWGMVCCSVHLFSRLGGEASFMETVAGTLGGRDSIRQRFLSFVESYEWMPETVRSTILHDVGWTP